MLVVFVGCNRGAGRSQSLKSPEPIVLTSNLDFEGGVGESRVPAFWSGGGEGYELAVDTTEKHVGTSSGRVRFVASSPIANGFGTLTKCTNAGPLTGAKITYEGFLKTADVGGWSGLWFRVDGPIEGSGHKMLAFDNMNDRPVRGTTEWARYEIVLSVPKEAVQVCFGFLLSGNGTVWGDDLSISRVPDN